MHENSWLAKQQETESNLDEEHTLDNSAWVPLISTIFAFRVEFSELTSSSDDSNNLFSSLILLIWAERSCWEWSTWMTFKFESSLSVKSNFSGLLNAYAAVTEAAAAAAAGDWRTFGGKESLGLGFITKILISSKNVNLVREGTRGSNGTINWAVADYRNA